DRPAEHDNPSVQPDPPRYYGTEAEQGGQVEHVGAEHNARADALLMTGQGAHRSGDLRRVGGQRRHHAEQCLRQSQPGADPLEAGYQALARRQADDSADDEDDYGDHWTDPGPSVGMAHCADQASRLTCRPAYGMACAYPRAHQPANS